MLKILSRIDIRIPQGSTLGPLLVNSLQNTVNCKYIMQIIPLFTDGAVLMML